MPVHLLDERGQRRTSCYLNVERRTSNVERCAYVHPTERPQRQKFKQSNAERRTPNAFSESISLLVLSAALIIAVGHFRDCFIWVLPEERDISNRRNIPHVQRRPPPYHGLAGLGIMPYPSHVDHGASMKTLAFILILLAIHQIPAAEDSEIDTKNLPASTLRLLAEYEKNVNTARTEYEKSLAKNTQTTSQVLAKELDGAMTKKDLDAAQAIKKMQDEVLDGSLAKKIVHRLTKANQTDLLGMTPADGKSDTSDAIRKEFIGRWTIKWGDARPDELCVVTDDSATRPRYKATWSVTADAIIIKWSNGLIHTIKLPIKDQMIANTNCNRTDQLIRKSD
jgi:hypothetical protein